MYLVRLGEVGAGAAKAEVTSLFQGMMQAAPVMAPYLRKSLLFIEFPPEFAVLRRNEARIVFFFVSWLPQARKEDLPVTPRPKGNRDGYFADIGGTPDLRIAGSRMTVLS